MCRLPQMPPQNVGFIIDGIGTRPDTLRIRSSRARLFPKKEFAGTISRKPICPAVFDQRVEIPIRYLTQTQEAGVGGCRSCLHWKIEARPRSPPVNLRGNVEPHLDGTCGAKPGASERRLLIPLRGASFFCSVLSLAFGFGPAQRLSGLRHPKPPLPVWSRAGWRGARSGRPRGLGRRSGPRRLAGRRGVPGAG